MRSPDRPVTISTRFAFEDLKEGGGGGDGGSGGTKISNELDVSMEMHDANVDATVLIQIGVSIEEFDGGTDIGTDEKSHRFANEEFDRGTDIGTNEKSHRVACGVSNEESHLVTDIGTDDESHGVADEESNRGTDIGTEK